MDEEDGQRSQALFHTFELQLEEWDLEWFHPPDRQMPDMTLGEEEAKVRMYCRLQRIRAHIHTLQQHHLHSY